MDWVLILFLGVVAGTVGGVVGFGSSIMLLPVLVWFFGPRDTIPIIAIAALMANGSRVLVWWREVDWKLNAAYCATAVPGAVIGARTLLSLNAALVEGTLGAFMLASIPIRRWLMSRGFRMSLSGMMVVGAGIGFLTGMVASTGPINTPFFLAYGLTKGSFIGSEAFGAAAVSLTKAATFHAFGALSQETLWRGLTIGAALMLGSWLSKRILLQMDATRFQLILEAIMVVAGLSMLWNALNPS